MPRCRDADADMMLMPMRADDFDKDADMLRHY